jgi:hypothetical protein
VNNPNHLRPVPFEDGIYKMTRVWDDLRTVCYHAAVVGPGWVHEGPCRDVALDCIPDLEAEQALRRWLEERAA